MPNFNIVTPSGQHISVAAPDQLAAMDSLLGQAGPDVSQIGSFSRGALSMLPLGDQAYAGVASLGEHKPYAQERQELEAEKKQDLEQNPGSTYAGKAAGLIAPIVATGGLAAPEELGAVAGNGLLRAAGEGALFGTGYGAGNAIDTLSTGGSGAQAAGDLAIGAGVGAGGGLAAKGLGKLLGGLGKESTIEAEGALGGVPHPDLAPIEGDVPSMINARGSVMPTGEIKGLSAAMPSASGSEAHIPAGGPNPVVSTAGTAGALPGNGYSETVNSPAASDSELRARQAVQMWGGSPGQIRKLPGKNLTQTINHMADIAEKNSTPGNDLFALTDRYGDRAQKYQRLHDQTGKSIGDLIENAKVTPIPADTVANEVLTKSVKLPTAVQKADLQELSSQIKGYADKDGNLDFKRLHQLKGDIGDTAFTGQGNDVKQGAYHVLSNMQEAEMHKAGAVDVPAFNKLKQTYEMTSRVTPMLRRATAKSLTGRPSLTELLSGHPVAALGKLGGERLEGIKNVVGFKVANALDNGAVQASGATGAQAAAAGAQALSPDLEKQRVVNNFVMSQRSPAAAKAASEQASSSAEPHKMAEGGVVQSIGDKMKMYGHALTSPVATPDSTLAGLQNVAHEIVHPTPPQPEAVAVKTSQPPQFHQSFNPQMAEQLRAYLLDAKKEGDENAE